VRSPPELDRSIVSDVVTRALAEDVGTGDLTAALVPADAVARATIVSREPLVLAGRLFVDEVFARLDDAIRIDWAFADADRLEAGAVVCSIAGPARPILTGERTALNLLQTLSGTASTTADYVAAVAGTGCRILDTRKTLPGLRLAQKYAVRCGGGTNHRIGLFDAILIKENHIMAAGGIRAAVEQARALDPGLTIEVEVESMDELRTASDAGVDRMLLDNFRLDELKEAVTLNRSHRKPAELEASGNVTLETVREIAATGVDFVSIGALTKHLRAIDLSMRFE